MKYRMLKKDLQRNKAVTAALFLFILLAAMLLASSATVITQLLGAMDALFQESQAPHFVQMHAGELDQLAIDQFAATHSLVAEQQTVEMLNISGGSVYLGDSGESEARSVIEISFVKQSPDFDYLLDLNNQVLAVAPGQVAVPVYYIKEKGLAVGDQLWVSLDGWEQEFTIVDFVRDVQMNPSLVTSKRFVLSDSDWQALKDSRLFESEYLIEFLLHDKADVSHFEQAYLASGLPQQDTAITYGLYQLLNALSDGLVAAVIILISLLLMAISLLCLRYALVAAVEEDYREIGAMKALGLSNRDIRSVYLVKYVTLAALASIGGYLLSGPLAQVFTANITLYMGVAAPSLINWLAPLLAALLVFLLIVLAVRSILGRFRKISAVEAMRGAQRPSGKHSTRRLPLHRSRNPFLNVLLGLREVVGKLSAYSVLCLVFALCVLLATVPASLLTTMESSEFITYMGAGNCDLRVDLQRSENIEERFLEMMTTLKADHQVERVAGFTTKAYQALDAAGNTVSIKVETGDFTIFPVAYAEGVAPSKSGEIALSVMNAEELGKNIGDQLILLMEEKNVTMTVSGIYQDVTNGGKTAKAVLDVPGGEVLWYVINADLTAEADVELKKQEYAEAFAPAKVLDMEEYLSQTLGSILDQLELAAICGALAAVVLCALITAMFLKMALAKDSGQIAVFRSLGFSHRHLRVQYVTRMLLVLLTGIVVGTVLSSVLGTLLAGGLLSMLGASSIQLVINPLFNYMLVPVGLAAIVILVTAAGSNSLKRTGSLRAALE